MGQIKLNTYQKIGIATVAATVFLIFVGALVRVSGSGLGCPDWPRCFGSWAPPTSASDLPARFDASQFNVYKTWTEYINRLVGVITGILITATFILSFRYRRRKPAVFYSSSAAFLMVLVQGWLGGEVVKSGLQELLITIHLLLAIAIMSVLLYAVFKATGEKWKIKLEAKTRTWIFWTAAALFICTLAQFVLGARVRGAIDLVQQAAGVPRSAWVQAAGSITKIHRSFAWTVLLSGAAIFYLCRWKGNSAFLRKLGTGLMAIIILQIVLGVGLFYLGLPPVYQILHLVVAAVLICLEFWILLVVHDASLPAAAGEA